MLKAGGRSPDNCKDSYKEVTKEEVGLMAQWLKNILGILVSPWLSAHRAGCHAQAWVRAAGVLLILVLGLTLGPSSSLAGLKDDHYDGNIFALYAGNGSLVPPPMSLTQSLQYGKPALVVIYVDDSGDCKQFASVISQLQAPYGRAANFIPVMADAIPVKASYSPNEPGYYFRSAVPQTLVFDSQGQLVFNQTGLVSYEAIDDAMRQVFDLLPRSDSLELRRRSVNEVNVELTPADP